jgi:hypothetical protein
MKLYTCLYDRVYSFIALMVRYDEPAPFPHTKIAAIAIPVDFVRIVSLSDYQNGFIRISTKKYSKNILPFCVLDTERRRAGKRFLNKRISLYKRVGLLLTKGREPCRFDQHLLIGLVDFFYDQHLSSPRYRKHRNRNTRLQECFGSGNCTNGL